MRSELSTDVKYAFGWAMVSYLTLGHAAGSGRDHRPCLSRYLDLLQTGMADGDAFAEAFGVGFPEFKQRVYRYVAKDEFPLVRIPYGGGPRGMPGLKAALLSRVLPQARTAVALGDLSEAIGRSDVAVEFYRRAHRLDPREPEALAGLGWQEAGAGNPEAARKHFEAALRYGEANPVVRASYGAFLLDQAQREKDWVRATELVAAARGHFSRAVQLDPENAIALLGLGKSCLIDCPDLQEGIRVVKEVGEVIPGSPSIQLALGRLFAKAQDWANARVQFEAVLRSNATVEAKQHATQALTQMAERTK